MLHRSEIIADIRDVSMSLGLLSPSLLTWPTYRCHGGRYTYDQVTSLGGFNSLRRAA